MPKLIFVNLPVADLPRARAFYEAMGARNEPMFTDETAACMVLSETIHVMLLTHGKFRQFTSKRIPDAKETCQVLLCLSAASAAEVDAIVARAAAAGGRADPGPKQDHGCMYGRSVEDPDGHVWEVMWMDLAAVKAAMGKA
ncbi:VOC family protein [Paracraurococcus lichenis]|uniref:Glyoxalase/bleomycin resistance/extradiol dioxygenase family protein n=1 Tax=Paracraurococcus lichenis TaxID=3064888 RepID=A0ABT9DXD5_9PROT|nr:VOC family protein [Paracraurococcus sp. LOR1-02]MDO9708450.1 glyoxalase/bleomycin resistance/extradiol dioxygenase family protein [Paracraurococcus sp. LOR1-02]